MRTSWPPSHSLFAIAVATAAVKVGKIGFAHSLLWVWLGLTLANMLPAAIRDVMGAWRFFARKDKQAFSHGPGRRDLLWRVGLGSALGPAGLIFMVPR